MAYGRRFEELEAGQRFPRWPGRTINEYDGALLSLPGRNRHPVRHHDHFGRRTQHGRRLAAGPPLISIVLGMTPADIGGRALETSYAHIPHDGPVFQGDAIDAESTMVGKRRLPGGRGAVRAAPTSRNPRREIAFRPERRQIVPSGGGNSACRQ